MSLLERCPSRKLHVYRTHLSVSLELEPLMQLFAATRAKSHHKNFKLLFGILSAYISEVSATYAVALQENCVRIA